ncbi:hypothetical protein [Streptomyces sp. NPDC048643]|uniref:hypothetical protein n=1 Tax=Streptomyces sp. NPDC048643 TaxID=3155637 RepID=UPI0034187FB7
MSSSTTSRLLGTRRGEDALDLHLDLDLDLDSNGLKAVTASTYSRRSSLVVCLPFSNRKTSEGCRPRRSAMP